MGLGDLVGRTREAVRAVLGPGKAGADPKPRKVVRCGCGGLAAADEVLEIPAEPCPNCQRLAPLLDGASDVFLCSPCSLAAGFQGIRTYFALRGVVPFSTPDLSRTVKEWHPKKARSELAGWREMLDGEERERALRIVRRCVVVECSGYCREVRGGVTTCRDCQAELHVTSVVRFCANESCSHAKRTPGLFQIKEGRCVHCGYPAAQRHVEIAKEVTG